MTTQYSLPDVLPKDATGLPFQAPVNISGSQMDFALQAGIAASVANGKNYAYMGVATHTQGGSVSTTDPGVAVLGYSGTPLSLGGNLQYLRLDSNGVVYTREADAYSYLSSGSTATSADTPHSLFGSYGGLSALASTTIIYAEVLPETNDALLLQSVVPYGRGTVLSTSMTNYKNIKPQFVGNVQNFHIRNKTPGANTTVNWVVYQKL